MKKILALSLCAFALGFTMPALADSHSGGEGGPKGGPFATHDTNGDGVISKSEFLSHAEERFGKMDVNGDGGVSQDEAKAAHKAKREKMEEKREKRQERRENRREEAK